MKLTGSLFDLAERRLIREKRLGLIPCYTGLDVVEYAVTIRKFLDNNPKRVKKIMKLTREERIRNQRQAYKRYNLKRKTK